MESKPKRGRGRPRKPDKLSGADYHRQYAAVKLDQIHADAPKGSRDRYKAAASASGFKSLQAWILATLDKAAADALQEPPQPPADAQTPTPDV